MLYLKDKQTILFRDKGQKYRPVSLYKGANKITGYEYSEVTGEVLSVSDTYNDNVFLKINGKTDQKVPAAGYTFYDYIDIPAGGAYFNTGVLPNQETSLEIDCKATATRKFLFGSRSASTGATDQFGMYLTSETIVTSQYNAQATNVSTSSAFLRTKYKLDKNIVYINDELKHIFTMTSFTGTKPVYLGTMLQEAVDGRTFQGRIYGAKMWVSGTLIRDFVPAKRSSDNVAGIYDLVGNVFYDPLGGGSVSVGTEILIPSPDHPSEIISVDGVGVNMQGKNIFPYNSSPITMQGVTLTYSKEEQCFILNGTSTATSGNLDFYVAPVAPAFTIEAGDSITTTIEELNGTRNKEIRAQLRSSSYAGPNFNLPIGTPKIISTYTAASEIVVARIYISVMSATGGVFDNFKFRIQVENGSTGTAYVEYREKQTTNFPHVLRSLPSGVKDEIVIDNVNKTAKLIRRVGFVEQLDGSESWGAYALPGTANYVAGYQAFALYSLTDSASGFQKSICSQFHNYNSVWGAVGVEGFSDHTESGYKYFKVLESRLGIVAEDGATERRNKFMAWLGSTIVEFQYELATPTVTNLDYEEIKTFYPYTNIYTTATIQPTLEGKLRVIDRD